MSAATTTLDHSWLANPPPGWFSVPGTEVQGVVGQPSLFGSGAPAFDDGFSRLQRRELAGGAWVDHQPEWLCGDDSLFAILLETVAWARQRRPMYDRMVDVPRLTGSLPSQLELEGHPRLAVIAAMARAIGARYGTPFDRLGFALYRDGRDSVAWHGDQVARDLHQAMVATVSLGEPRPFALRPKGGGRSIHYQLGHGDLLVMGGTCQRTWDHAVPKVARAGPRIAVMFRPAWARAWSAALR
jgi:alkylated DNA repair dioxygenase AlkB